MINQSKPSSGSPQTYLDIGSSYNLLIGGVYKLIIGALSTVGITNLSKVSTGETWATASTTWATETRTWLAISQLIGNTSKPTTSITNISKPV